LAISDPAQLGAYPLGTVERRSTVLDLADIQRRIADREVSRIVVGLPLNMDGSEGSIARAARNFGTRLGEYLGLPIDFHDERLSSVEADERMRPMLSGRRRKAVLDSVAAAVILEGWMQAHPRTDRDNAQG